MEILPVFPYYVTEIIQRFEKRGESAFVVGGGLRDILLGIVPNDYDIATSALPEKTEEIFSDKKTVETGIKHGTVTVIYDGHPVEITTFRIDGRYSDSRHPDTVCFASDIAEDLSRRDFTVNAMAYSESTGLIDPFEGRLDLGRRLIRAVGDPYKRFDEDALRIMRAFRFSAQLGFEIEADTLSAAIGRAAGLENIARERISVELLRLITAAEPEKSMEYIFNYGILRCVFGEYSPSEKIIRLIRNAPLTPHARLGLLLFEADGETVEGILSSLRLSNKIKLGVKAIIRGAGMRIENEAEARKLIAVTGDYAVEAARVSELVGISSEGAAKKTERQRNAPHSIGDLKINGKDLAELGFRGKSIGDTLNILLAEVMDVPSLNKRDLLLRRAEELFRKKANGEGS